MASKFNWNSAPAVLVRQILDANPDAFQHLKNSPGAQTLTVELVANWQAEFVKHDGTLKLENPVKFGEPLDPGQLCLSWLNDSRPAQFAMMTAAPALEDSLLLIIYLEAHRHTAIKRESIKIEVPARRVPYQEPWVPPYEGNKSGRADLYYEDSKKPIAYLVELKLFVKEDVDGGGLNFICHMGLMLLLTCHLGILTENTTRARKATGNGRLSTYEAFHAAKLQSRSYHLKEHVPSNLEYWACLLEPNGWYCGEAGPPLLDFEYICKSLESIKVVDDLKGIYRESDIEELKRQCARLTIPKLP